MKLTFSTSLLLLTTAAASSSSGGGLRSRRLSLFAEDAVSSSKANKNSDSVATEDPPVSASKSDKNEGGDPPVSNSKSDKNDGGGGGKSGKDNEGDGDVNAKSGKSGNVLGGAKAAKSASEYMKTEAPRPFSGIETDDDLYYFGEDISASFYLNEDYISAAALEHFNSTHVQDYTIAMYSYMGRPNCDGNPAIASVAVTIADGGTADPIDYDGSFTLSTSPDFQELGGTGYDLFLLDETGCNIILGPEAVTITLTPEAQAAEDDEAKAKSSKARTVKAKVEKEKIATKKTYKKMKEKVDQSKVELAGKQALSTEDYTLTTDQDEYELGQDIAVTYNLSALPDATAEGRRLKKKKKKTTEGLTEDEVVAFNAEAETADDSDAPVDAPAETAAADAPLGDYDPNYDESLVQPDPEISEDDGQEESEEGSSPQPDELPDVALEEEETEVDPTDITLFKLGVFMKMANPQRGKLLPLFELPLCDAESCTAEEIAAGSFTFSASEIDTTQYGTGFDLWILDGTGDGIAGPKYFTIGEE